MEFNKLSYLSGGEENCLKNSVVSTNSTVGFEELLKIVIATTIYEQMPDGVICSERRR